MRKPIRRTFVTVPGIAWFVVLVGTGGAAFGQSPPSSSKATPSASAATTQVSGETVLLARVKFSTLRPVEPADGPRRLSNATAGNRPALRLAEPLDLTDASWARLTLRSWLTAEPGSLGRIEVSRDGVTWDVVRTVDTSDRWVPVAVDLSAYVGTRLYVRFVLHSDATSAARQRDEWIIDSLVLEIDPRCGLDTTPPDDRFAPVTPLANTFEL